DDQTTALACCITYHACKLVRRENLPGLAGSPMRRGALQQWLTDVLPVDNSLQCNRRLRDSPQLKCDHHFEYQKFHSPSNTRFVGSPHLTFYARRPSWRKDG